MVIYFVYVVMKNFGKNIAQKNLIEKSFSFIYRESQKPLGGIQACLIQLKPVFQMIVAKIEFSRIDFYEFGFYFLQKDKVLFS